MTHGIYQGIATLFLLLAAAYPAAFLDSEQSRFHLGIVNAVVGCGFALIAIATKEPKS